MKGCSKLILGWLVAAMLIAGPRADAQAFGLAVTPSVSTLMVGNSLTYTISVTNFTSITFPDVWVTNTFSSPIQYISATASQAFSSFNHNATNVWFDFMPVSPGVVQVSLTVQPSTAGFLTNTVMVADTTTNTASASAVVQVTNLVADLGVTMTGPKQAVITNDWMTYGVSVTNSGPNAASTVTLTNMVPAGVMGISSPKQSSGTHQIPLGTLPNGGFTNLFFTVEPTNAGALSFSASVGASTLDTNTANSVASTNITVTNYFSGPFGVTTNSAQMYNPQNGLVEQSITVTNNTSDKADAVRVIVTGLPCRLFNAVGTNNGNPFVYYSTNLAAGRSVSLLLQYAASAYFPSTNGQLRAFAVPTPDWTPPPATATSTNMNISRIVELANGRVLIEWPSITNRTYTVVYSDNVLFSNAMIAPPSIVAPANRTQWIDYGPPTTVSAPTNTPMRFYRVYQNP